MGRANARLVGIIVLGATLGAWFAFWLEARGEPATFRRMSLPEGIAGDCKAVGDLDGDGLLDVVVAGKAAGEPLVWYRHGSWEARTIAVSRKEFSNDCVIADLNQDGFLDLVVPDATTEPHNLSWFENPGPRSILTTSQWKRHPIGHTGSWCKDLRTADLDSDGRLDIVARPLSRKPIVFFRDSNQAWNRLELPAKGVGREGMTIGDLDGDGDADIVAGAVWVENPSGPAARDSDKWRLHPIGDAPADFKAFTADIDGDGDEDVLMSSSEGAGPVVWWENPSSASVGWKRHVVVERAKGAHTLWGGDFDRDGHMDVLIAELGRPRVSWSRNADGGGQEWESKSIEAKYGSIHNGVVADLDRDGDLDLFGAGFTGRPTKATIWWNLTNPRSRPIGPFTPIEVTDQHKRAFGMVPVDLDQDGSLDLASGRYWYRNPGGDMGGPWEQRTFPAVEGQSVDVIASLVGPSHRGLFAMTPDGRVWWLTSEGEELSVNPVGKLPEADHGISTQGVEIAQLLPDGLPELVVSNGGGASTGVGIYAFRMLSEGAWARRRITPRTSDEGIAVGDIDRDGDLDLVGTRGDLGEVEWYANPGTLAEDWDDHPIARLDNVVWLDRTRTADLNCDGRLDVVVTEENGLGADAEVYWLEQPRDPKRGSWPIHELTSQGSTNSLDVADFDDDGDVDIVTGEHRGALRTVVWENRNCKTLTPRTIDRGKESHLGSKAVDLDRDGDLDIVSIGWDEPHRIHLWRNDAAHRRSATSTR